MSADAPGYTLAEAAAELGWPLHPLCTALCRLYWLRRAELTVGRRGTRTYYVPTAPALNRGDLDIRPAVFRAAGEHHHYPRTYVTRRGLTRLRTTLPAAAGNPTATRP